MVALSTRLWSWGWGVHGQLGLEGVDNKLLPTHASRLDEWQVLFIAAGYGHSAVLTAEVRRWSVCCGNDIIIQKKERKKKLYGTPPNGR